MIPYTEVEAAIRLLAYRTVFTMTRNVDGKIEYFILENEEVIIKELHNDKQKL